MFCSKVHRSAFFWSFAGCRQRRAGRGRPQGKRLPNQSGGRRFQGARTRPDGFSHPQRDFRRSQRPIHFLFRRDISFGCTEQPGDSETGDRHRRGRFGESGDRRRRLGRRRGRAAEILFAFEQARGRNQVGPASQRQQARSRNQRQRADYSARRGDLHGVTVFF